MRGLTSIDADSAFSAFVLVEDAPTLLIRWTRASAAFRMPSRAGWAQIRTPVSPYGGNMNVSRHGGFTLRTLLRRSRRLSTGPALSPAFPLYLAGGKP